MSRPLLRVLISAGSVSFGLAVVAAALHAGGCANTYEDYSTQAGTCEDDGNPCTIDKCVNGVAVHEVVKEELPCALGQNTGICKGPVCELGCASNPTTCQCATIKDCPEVTECMAWLCEAGHCKQNPQKMNQAIAEQTMGDCQEIVCNADGTTKSVNKDDDVPASGPCFMATCSGGVEQKANTKLGENCTGGVCDGMGACVDCLSDADWMTCGKTCGVKKCEGQACTGVADCKTGFCADGVCCASACTEECKSCNVMGKVGQCEFVALYQNDDKYTDANGFETTCLKANSFTCDGKGACLKLGGSGCGINTECVGGACESAPNGNMLCFGKAGEPCNSGPNCKSGVCSAGFCT